jgi:hypothetical protein
VTQVSRAIHQVNLQIYVFTLLDILITWKEKDSEPNDRLQSTYFPPLNNSQPTIDVPSKFCEYFLSDSTDDTCD